MFGRKKQPTAPPTPAAFNGLYTWPPAVAPGIVRGVLVTRQERTQAGCVIMPGELDNLPTLLLLKIGELLAPMKWLADGREADLARTAKLGWTVDQDPLLLAADAARLGAIGREVAVYGFPHPMYTTGTIAAVRIWGFYVRPA